MDIVMKQQDINAVLQQAAELRTNLGSAIDRSLLAHFSRLPLSSAAPALHSHNAGHGDDNEYDYLPIFASVAALEARSLASIRDALIVLEEQLECLQTLPDQRREEKKATLAELEESREILLRRLKQHRGGRELAVIEEAYSFVGEANEGEDKLLLRSYTMPARLIDTDVRHKIMGGVDVSIEDVRSYMDKHREKADKSGKRHDGSTRSRGLLGDLKSRLLSFLSRRLTKVSAKCLFAMAGAAAVLTLSNNVHGSNMRGRKHASSTVRQKGAACPENWAAIHSGGHRCVLTEPIREES
ncbi:hypothetical protein GOP47_0002640 [Adiantum capillus-veneris]|uniref:Uncharacterized protein n=1 Tax=Adiantum capillus-veneris TaxID=13818 RepID=A0A9D4ZRG2_ADICA|nr:hypothetical protein GOP47_0002640 [Adiantum capillus-veneris]